MSVAALLPVVAAAQTAPLYENRGTVNTPQVDARVLLNSGTFNVSVTQPYETLNTLSYTNNPNGLMQGGIGFRFDYSTPTNRGLASSFFNAGSIVAANSSFSFASSGITFGGVSSIVLPSSFLLISSTNVASPGLMSVSSDGIMQIKGHNVNLARGGLRTGDVPGAPTSLQRGSVIGGELYRNPDGVTDLYSGIGTNNNFAGTGSFNVSQLQMPGPTSGRHEVLRNLFTNRVSVGSPLNRYAAWAMTNKVSPTNVTIQAVFVATNNPDPNFAVRTKFGRSTDPSATPDARMPIVEMGLWEIDAVTGLPTTNYVYILDSTAVLTNLIHYTNVISPTVFRPSTLEVTRGTPIEWRSAADGNTAYTNSLLVSADFAGTTVTNAYAGYSVQIGSAASSSAGFAGGFYFGFFDNSGFLDSPVFNDPTNLPGRIEIEAENFDMSLIRVRSEGLLTVKTANLQGTAPGRIDAPQMVFDLGSTNSLLSISNVIPESIRRLDGQLSMYSTVFTNQILSVVNTNTANPTDPAGFVTNTIDAKCHVLIVDPSFVTLRQVGIREISLRATNVLINDRLTVSGNLLIDAETLTTTTNALVSLSGDPSLDITNFPRLKNWTNNGIVSVGNSIEAFQTDSNGFPLLLNFVNRGTVSASTLSLHGESLESIGQLNMGRGPINLKGNSVKLSGGRVVGAGDISLDAPDIKLRGVTIQAGNTQGINYTLGAFNLLVSERLSDGGADAKNSITTYNGINLLSRPKEGDLFGTRVRSIAPRYVDVQHVWAGEDRGPGAAGFSNNVVIGNLVLDGDFNSRFSFKGLGSNNAIYVDYLELTNYATNVTTSFNIDPNMTIYFAAANVAVETLDGAFDGRLKWARSFAGPLSSTNLTLANGQTFTVNRSVLSSATIDSDGDGLVNRLDPSPFDGVRITTAGVTNAPVAATFITWNAAPQLDYTVEYKTSLSSTNWLSLTNVINLAKTNVVVRVFDPIRSENGEKYFRVRYNP